MSSDVPIIGECQVCGAKPGQWDADDKMKVPYGELATCDLCGKRVCPVCLGEYECCFGEYEEGQLVPFGWEKCEDGFRRIK